jgi:hypothetical protein
MTDVANAQAVLCKIANCAFGVVGNLLNRDQLLAEKLRSSKTKSRQIFREECITLEMAATLKETFPEQVDLTVFTPPEEALNGADWYLRVQKDDFAIHARVQVKRVQRSAFGQLDSDGKVEFDTGQLCKLIAAANSLPELQAWVATFARYDAAPPCGARPSCCPNHRCNRDCEKEGSRPPSIWIAQAREFANRMLPVTIEELVGSSLRLDCILPCIRSQGNDGPAQKGFAVAPGLPSFDDCVEAIQTDGAFEGALQIKV